MLLLAGVALAQKTIPDQIWGSIYNLVLPTYTSPQVAIWQGDVNGRLHVAGLAVGPAQFLLQAPGAGFVLQTNAVAKICLAGTC